MAAVTPSVVFDLRREVLQRRLRLDRPLFRDHLGMVGERRFEDPLELIEHVLEVLRTDAERDEAIERLIQDLEDERATLVAGQLRRRQ